MTQVANLGSALGEAIGSLLEQEIHDLLRPIVQQYGAVYIASPQDISMKARRKLILTDQDGNYYEVDAVIVNQRFQPLVLLESKYIRYKKHNRDKASWICTAHTKLRAKFPTIRRSVAILMGSWSRPSKRLLTSFDVTIFEISFERICEVLAKFGINYAWAETDREAAMQAWQRFNELTVEQCKEIARHLISDIEHQLAEAIRKALDESVPRRVRRVSVIVTTERGETFSFHFNTIQEASEFLRKFDECRDLDTTNAPTLLCKSPKTNVR
jgi:hypothetical protein